MKRLGLGLGAILLLALTFLTLNQNEGAKSIARTASAPLPVTQLPFVSESAPRPLEPEKYVPPAPLRPPLTPPQPKLLAEQVKADPHRTPPALLAFAADLSERMDQAAQDPKQVSKLFKDLESCVSQGAALGTVTTQAICLNHAHELAKKDVSLDSRYTALKNGVSAEVLRLADAVPSDP